MAVPNLPGVPALAQFATATVVNVLVSDAISALLGNPAFRWGIFQNGIPVVIADNVLSMEYRQDWTVGTYQIEQGGFQNYDKVSLPFSARVRFSAGGSEANRQALLDSIAAISGTTGLFDILTPEEIYSDVNVTHYDYRREARAGLGLISVDVHVQEIRLGSGTLGQSTQSVSAQSPQSGGAVQTIPVQSSALPAIQ